MTMRHAAIVASTCALLAGTAAAGPDVLGRDFSAASRLATVGGTSAYGFGPTTCNIGTAFLGTNFGTSDHPAIGFNVYRVKDGRLEQIGMSWAFHMICSLQGTICGTCQPPPGGGCNPELGVLCSTNDTAIFSGNQTQLGPRSQVNAATGLFPFPFTAPATTSLIDRRLQVNHVDLDPALNPGAQYFVEMVYVSADDAGSLNSNNNASSRRVNVSGSGGGPYNFTFAAPTAPGASALQQWAAADPAVGVNAVDVAGDGRFYVASKATQISCSRYRYDYAVFNLSSDRSAASFSIPAAAPGAIANAGFHDVNYHSGETISGTDWSPIAGSCEFSWATDDFGTDPNANAIRWGTTYSFSFESRFAPVIGDAAIGLFKPGAVMSVDVGVSAPGNIPAFAGDYDGDAAVGLGDIAFVITEWTNPCGSPFGLSSIADVITNWGNACP
jgi:hypothetical protein